MAERFESALVSDKRYNCYTDKPLAGTVLKVARYTKTGSETPKHEGAGKFRISFLVRLLMCGSRLRTMSSQACTCFWQDHFALQRLSESRRVLFLVKK
jgi:hypothetical protein